MRQYAWGGAAAYGITRGRGRAARGAPRMRGSAARKTCRMRQRQFFTQKSRPAWMQRGKALCLFKIAIWRVICLLECTSSTTQKRGPVNLIVMRHICVGAEPVPPHACPKALTKNGGQEFWHEQATQMIGLHIACGMPSNWGVEFLATVLLDGQLHFRWGFKAAHAVANPNMGMNAAALWRNRFKLFAQGSHEYAQGW